MLRNCFTTHNDWRDGDLSNIVMDGKLFQIDALLGATAAIAEMLIQYSDDGTSEDVPTAIDDGSFDMWEETSRWMNEALQAG